MHAGFLRQLGDSIIAANGHEMDYLPGMVYLSSGLESACTFCGVKQWMFQHDSVQENKLEWCVCCRVRKGMGSQSVVVCMAKYPGGESGQVGYVGVGPPCRVGKGMGSQSVVVCIVKYPGSESRQQV